jgi:MFS family permease
MNPRILVLTLSTFAFGSTAFIFAGVLETMAQDLGVATAVAGQLQTSYVLVSALLGPPLAWLLGKADRKVVLAAALGFGALANLLRCYVVGRWEQYARSGFSREPLAQWPQQWPMLYFACLSQSDAPSSN